MRDRSYLYVYFKRTQKPQKHPNAGMDFSSLKYLDYPSHKNVEINSLTITPIIEGLWDLQSNFIPGLSLKPRACRRIPI